MYCPGHYTIPALHSEDHRNLIGSNRCTNTLSRKEEDSHTLFPTLAAFSRVERPHYRVVIWGPTRLIQEGGVMCWGRWGKRCTGKGRGEVCWEGEGRDVLGRGGERYAGKGREGSDVLGKGRGRDVLEKGGERCAGKGRGEVCWKGEGRGMLERRGEICAGKGREEMCWKGKGRDGLERGGKDVLGEKYAGEGGRGEVC